MRLQILTLCVAVSVVLPACHRGGGQSPAAPSSTVPQLVMVLSGRTGQQVPVFGNLQAAQGQILTLSSAGFFTLRTEFRGDTIFLWPADDGFLSSHHTRRLVYGGVDGGQLHRLPPTVSAISLVPDVSIRAASWAFRRVELSADVLTRSHAALAFAVDGGGFPITLEVNAADPGFINQPGAAALTYSAVDATGVISGVRIVFRTLQVQGFWQTQNNFQVAVTHEAIHGTGLNHSDEQDPPGIMSLSTDSYRFLEPTVPERLIMAMQYRRLPGTTLTGTTERDPGVVAASDRGRPVWRLVCAHGLSGRE